MSIRLSQLAFGAILTIGLVVLTLFPPWLIVSEKGSWPGGPKPSPPKVTDHQLFAPIYEPPECAYH